MIDYSYNLHRLLHSTVKTSLKNISLLEQQSSQPHLQIYLKWLQNYHWEDSNLFSTMDLLENDAIDQLMLKIEEAKPAWKMFVEAARNFHSIIRGTVDPLALLISTDLAEQFYNEIFKNLADTETFRTFLDLASHENPNLEILEVGAGVGGFTAPILMALHDFETLNGGARFSKYVYTDVSPAFFEGAKSKFQRFTTRMEFLTLDLETDMIIQGFNANSYDMVIAGGVLLATTNLSRSLQNIHKVLKPGGKLVFFEVTNPVSLPLNYGFGILPGWCKSVESWRENGPAVDVDRWSILLKENGYSGNDLVLRDFHDDICHNFSIIISTSDTTHEAIRREGRILLVVDCNSTTQAHLAYALSSSTLSRAGYRICTIRLEDLQFEDLKTDDTIVSSLSSVNQCLEFCWRQCSSHSSTSSKE